MFDNENYGKILVYFTMTNIYIYKKTAGSVWVKSLAYFSRDFCSMQKYPSAIFDTNNILTVLTVVGKQGNQ